MVNPQNEYFNDLELMNILSEIERTISSSDCKHVLLAGDINCDFSRNTNRVNIFKQFIESNGLAVFWTMSYNPDNNSILDYITRIITVFWTMSYNPDNNSILDYITRIITVFWTMSHNPDNNSILDYVL